MKKIFILALVFVGFSAKVHAQEIISSAQLDAYKNSISYMSCVYSGKTRCVGASSLQEAREMVAKFKSMTAAGLNASKKASYDAMAADLLMFITVDEAKAYIDSLKNKSSVEMIEEYVDGAQFKSVITMPGEKTLELAEKGVFNAQGMNQDSITKTVVSTKEEMLAKAKENAAEDEDRYVHTPTYLEGVKYGEEAEMNTTYTSYENGKLVILKSVIVTEYNGMSMKMTNESNVSLRRVAEENYAIKMVESEVISTQEVDGSIYDPAKKHVIKIEMTADLNQVSAETRDEKWINRYNKVMSEDAKQSRYESNYLMLKYALSRVEKYAEEIKQADSEDKVESLNKKRQQFIKNSKIYYDNLSEFADDEKVKAIRAKYNSMTGSM